MNCQRNTEKQRWANRDEEGPWILQLFLHARRTSVSCPGVEEMSHLSMLISYISAPCNQKFKLLMSWTAERKIWHLCMNGGTRAPQLPFPIPTLSHTFQTGNRRPTKHPIPLCYQCSAKHKGPGNFAAEQRQRKDNPWLEGTTPCFVGSSPGQEDFTRDPSQAEFIPFRILFLFFFLIYLYCL